MSLRIIAGNFKNHLLKTPKGDRTRPTSALVRKAVFDICKDRIEDSHFLDLYAGSGAIGIEALSRGASHATFVEKDKAALHCLFENLKNLSLMEKVDVFAQDVSLVLKKLAKLQKSYSLIYIDPPYVIDVMPILKWIDDSSLLANGGILFLEQRSSANLDFSGLHSLSCFDSRKFGTTQIHQLRRFKNL